MLPLAPHRFFEGGALPSEYRSEDGQFSVALKTDFRVWLKYEFLKNQDSLSQEDMAAVLLSLCCADAKIEAPLPFVFDALVWFHSCGDVERTSRLKITPLMREKSAKREPLVDIFWDSFTIWESFKNAHKIDLFSCGELHWWDFRRLLSSLPADCALNGLRQARRSDLRRNEYIGDEKKAKGEMRERLAREWDFRELDRLFLAIPPKW